MGENLSPGNTQESSINTSAVAASSVNEGLPFKVIFHHADRVAVRDYVESFSQQRRNEVERVIFAFELFAADPKGRVPMSDAVQSLYKDFRSLKGLARTVHAALTMNLLEEAESLVYVANDLDGFLIPKVADFSIITAEVLELVWEIKESMADCGTEEDCWRAPLFRERYKKTFASIEALRNR